jgi:phosphate:Na+ symporter
MAEATGPPESQAEQERLTRTLHSLDHASRLGEVAEQKAELTSAALGADDVHATEFCVEAMRNAAVIGGAVGALPHDGDAVSLAESSEGAIVKLEVCAKTLSDLQPAYRKATLASVAGGTTTTDEAMARVDMFRWLEALARHAWRSAAHLMYQPPPS